MTATITTRARSLLLIALALAWQTEALGRTRGRGRRIVGGAIAGAYYSILWRPPVMNISVRYRHWLCRRRRGCYYSPLALLPSVQASSFWQGSSPSCRRRRRPTAIVRGPTGGSGGLCSASYTIIWFIVLTNSNSFCSHLRDLLLLRTNR